MAYPPHPEASAGPTPRLLDLFLAFTGVAVMGFGGVLPWARRMLVERRQWLTPDEFTEVLSLGQFLPGGNIINVAVVVGERFRGAPGALAAMVGLLAAPFAIVLGLGALYLRYAHLTEVEAALDGVAAAAAGLILAMAARMAAPLFRRGAGVPLLFAALTFAGVGLFQFSLPLVLIVLAPVSVAVAWNRK